MAEDEEIGCVHDTYDPYTSDYWQRGRYADENYFSRMYKNGEFVSNLEFGSIVLKPWMIFSDKEHFMSVFRDYCIQCGFVVVVDRSSPRRFTTSCLALNCGWRIHSSRLPDGVTWAIKNIKNPEHTCGGLDERNPLVTVKWAAEKLLEDIRENNDISGKTLNDLLFSRYGVHMATNTLYKMRGVALKEINGGHDTSYGYLPKYCEMVKETNLGLAANCAWKQLNPPDPSLTFSSIFISFKAAIDGVVAGCRSLVGVDGAHLKGHFGGVLLSVVAIDGNNELFPFSWAIVPKEDGDSWKYFFWHLKHILSGSGRGNGWSIISDRQKGIDVALNELWPEVDRRYCSYQSNEGEYEVKDGKFMLPVSLHRKTCLCGAWKISGLPCKHAIKAILAAGLNPYQFCSTWFSVQTYKQAYANAINYVPDIEHWPKINMPTILPPVMKRAIGRPSRQRKRAPDEPDKGKRSTTVQCQRCKCYGHNKQTCKGGFTTTEQSARDGQRNAKAKAKNAAKKTS
ncbi:uncharacterized protein LOC110726260 [Chenopodium quinoa]|uniref:uncharacterized protein LOC110726260 n=1 Tax=Chenopodium quinoa TaxID=63459 RepID=UPI000B7928A7|nr:uncharacterized protein LOC110726260 [Chenopodium quinoa]